MITKQYPSMPKKLYLVKYEVRANSVAQALRTRGVVYEVALAAEETRTKEPTKPVGFKKK